MTRLLAWSLPSLLSLTLPQQHADQTIIHPAGPIASALLATAEAHGPITGHEFITAFIADIEAECKLDLSVSPEHYNTGWHITSTTGSIGAAISVAKLLNLSTPQIQHAIGIASTHVTGMQAFFGSDTKALHIGRAAQTETGTRLLCTHLRQDSGGRSIQDVKTMDVRVNPEVLVLTGKTEPQDGLQAKFSIYHAAAVALLYGEATPAQLTDGVVGNEIAIRLRKKVNVVVDDVVSRAEAYVKLTFDDGAVLERHVQHAKGSIKNPLTEEELERKFLGQVGLAIGWERAADASRAFAGVVGMEDVGRVRGMY
ncbi:MmgE/PrpD protein [Pyrenophora tritici-repentis]|nr:MmgE/PrpD protein [Pyrenophora tritici-repentis]